jgi:tetratricopeptide (TPR) repeat protein
LLSQSRQPLSHAGRL